MKKASFGGVLAAFYYQGLRASAAVFGAERTRYFDARLRYGRSLNLVNPTTLADKVSWLEFHTDQRLSIQCTDKYAVREYVANRGLANILIPVVGGPWESVDEIKFEKLPNQFVIKATHGCDMNLFCLEKDDLNITASRKTLAGWLKREYDKASLEPHYKGIQPRLYGEQYIGGLGDVIDYKFHCINGEPMFVLVCSQRDSKNGLMLNLYDMGWEALSGLQGKMVNPHPVPKPENLKRMIEVSRALAAGSAFVRVDLYNSSGKVLFGELTFSPAGGVFPYFSDEFIHQYGKELDI